MTGQQSKRRRSLSPRYFIPLALGLAYLVPLHGQETPEDDEVFELSPFSVDGSEDTGYRATSTLAGTRLKTSLKDVGASISVATKEFMDDIGATDIESLLTYTGGTEAVGLNGNYQAAKTFENDGQVREERTNARQQTETRVRGLARADLTMNLFITDRPFDGFNINRVTVSRGANAALFGLGSPGGVLDAGLKRANFRNSVEIQTRHDDWGSDRYVFDINRSLIEDKLALRLIGLSEDIAWEQRGAYERDTRYFADVLFKPTENTFLRAFWSEGEIRAARPNTSPPHDNITPWVEMGKPLYDGVTARYYSSLNDWVAGNPIPLEQSNNLWRGNPDGYPNLMGGGELVANDGRRLTIIFPDPNSSEPGGVNGSPQGMQVRLSDPAGGSDGWPGGADTQWYNPSDLRTLFEWPVGSYPSARGLAPDLANFYPKQVITDRGFFDYRTALQETPNKMEQGDMEHFNISLEQTFLEGDLGIELAYDDQFYGDSLVKFSRVNQLNIDNQLRLADGSPNPNVGRAYTGGNAFAEPQRTWRESTRFTGFYQLDFAEKSDGWASKLGKHVFTLNGSRSKINFQQETHMAAVAGPEFHSFTENRDVTQNNVGGIQRSQLISYVSGSLLDIANTSDFNIKGVNVIQRVPDVLTDVIAWNGARAASLGADHFAPTTRANIQTKLDNVERGTLSTTFYEYLDDPSQTWTWGGRASYSEVESQVAILQSHFANNNIVTTASWRWDDVTVFDYGTTTGSRGLENGFQDIPTVANLDIDGQKTTGFSIVAHTPQFINEKLPDGMNLSFHYNTSSNFVAGGTRTTIFGERLPQQAGDTKDFGFSLRGLNNKLDLKVNFFESTQVGASENPKGRPNNIWVSVLEWNTPEEIAAAGIPAPPQGFLTAYEFEESIPGGREQQFYVDNGDGSFTETTIVTSEWSSRNPQQNAIVTPVGQTESEGMEIEIAYNPTRNWRMMINGTRAEAVRSDIAAPELSWLEQRTPLWLDPNVGGQIWLGDRQRTILDGDGEVIGVEPNYDNLMRDPRDGSLHQNLTGLINDVNKFAVFDGLPAPELREWRWNFITNYQLGENAPGPFKRMAVGAAYRWEDSSFLGTGLKRDETGSLTQDVTRLFEGPSNDRVDFWVTYKQRIERLKMDWRMRLGVNNAFSSEGLIPTASNPDGEYGVFRVEPPTTWSITNTFSF